MDLQCLLINKQQFRVQNWMNMSSLSNWVSGGRQLEMELLEMKMVKVKHKMAFGDQLF